MCEVVTVGMMNVWVHVEHACPCVPMIGCDVMQDSVDGMHVQVITLATCGCHNGKWQIKMYFANG